MRFGRDVRRLPLPRVLSVVFGGAFLGTFLLVFIPSSREEPTDTARDERRDEPSRRTDPRDALSDSETSASGEAQETGASGSDGVGSETSLSGTARKGGGSIDFLAPMTPFAPGRTPPALTAGGELPSFDGVPLQPGTSEAEAQGGSTVPSEPITGVVLDAGTGDALALVRVRATAFRALARPEGELLEIAGTPPRAAFETRTDEGGRFELPLYDPTDATALLHIELSGDGVRPLSAVLAGRDGIDGVWTRVIEATGRRGELRLRRLPSERPGAPPGAARVALEIELRRALTIPVRLIDPVSRAGLPGLPVRVTPRRDGYDFLDSPHVEIGIDGRLLVPEAPWVLSTDSRGTLWLPFRDTPYDLELLDPFRHLELDVLHTAGAVAIGEPGAPQVIEHLGDTHERVTIVLPFGGTVVIAAYPNVLVTHRLLDRDRRPIPDAEVELALEGAAPRRVSTGPDGRFTAGVVPFTEGAGVLSMLQPRPGRLLISSPSFPRISIDVAFPRRDEDIVLDVGPEPPTVLRFVDGLAAEPDPVPVLGFRSDLDLLPLRFDPDGSVELVGAPEEVERDFRLEVRGQKPVVHQFGANAPDGAVVDRQPIRLERGLSQKFVLRAESGPLPFDGAELALRPLDTIDLGSDEDFAIGSTWPVSPAGDVDAFGLSPGPYHVAVEGPHLAPFETELVIHETTTAEPIELLVERTAIEEVRVAGRVIDLAPHDAARTMVVERWEIRGEREPVAFPPYPLAPDGTFASIRRLAGVDAVSVTVIALDDEAAEAGARRPSLGTPAWFVFDSLRIRPRPRADVRFVAPGVGVVLPPLEVAVRGERGAETIARLRLGWHVLHIDDLRRGRYTISWREGGRIETASFDVATDSGAVVDVTAERAPLPREIVEVRVEDSRGQPIASARAKPEAAPLVPKARRPAGATLVGVTPGAPVSFRVGSEGYLPARVDVPAGGTIPTLVTLYRPVGVTGRILGPDGRDAEGRLLIDWEPLEDDTIEHGDPVATELIAGRFRVAGLPPVKRRFRFRLESSDVAVTRVLTLPEDDEVHDLGTIRLAPSRSLVGRVFQANGSPARDVRVFVLPAELAHRYPFDSPLDEARLPFTTTTDAEGAFRLEGLPIELPRDLALAARRDNLPSGVEWPIDLDASFHELVLGEPNRLEIEAGYRIDGAFDAWRFTLFYQGEEGDGAHSLERPVELGEIVPEWLGFHSFEGVRPGRYRLRWGLRDAYEPLPWLWHDVWLPPGGAARLSLVLDGRVLRGRATLNGAVVERGWVLLTHEPGLDGATRVGRIKDGEYTLIDPPDTFRAWAAVIPEEDPLPVQDIRRGEALPVEVRGYRLGVARGRVDIDYAAHTLTLRFAPGFFERHQGATLHYATYTWQGTSFEKGVAFEAITEPIARFHLLRPDEHRVTVRSIRDTLIHGRTVSLRDDDQILDFR